MTKSDTKQTKLPSATASAVPQKRTSPSAGSAQLVRRMVQLIQMAKVNNAKGQPYDAREIVRKALGLR